MQKHLVSSRLAICLALFAAFFIITGQAEAQMKIAGKLMMAYAKIDSLSVGDAAGHLMTFGESKGTNTSSGENDFMNGAESVNLAYSDLTMGTGPHQGYVVFKNGDDMTVAKWQGMVNTTMSDEGVPNTTFTGTYEYIKGTGMYQGISGKGTYKGQFNSKTEYVVDWEGQYSLK